MEPQSRIENILKLTASPNKAERKQAEDFLKEMLKNSEFVFSLLSTYMKSSDPVVANISASIFKSGVKNIENKKDILLLSIKEMGNEILNNFSDLNNRLQYKMIKDVLVNYLQAEYFDDALKLSENNEYLLLEILYIIMKNSKLGSVVLREVLMKYWNFLMQSSNNSNYAKILIEIFEIAIKKTSFKEEQCQFIVSYITNIIIQSEDITLLEETFGIFHDLYNGTLKEKVAYKGFKPFITEKSYVENFFKQIINISIKYKGIVENEQLLITTAEIITLFVNNGYFLNHLLELVDIIIVPSLYGDEELFDEFFTDTEEYSNRIYNLYVETYGEVLSNLLYDATMKLSRIARGKQVINKLNLYIPSQEEANKILEEVYKYLLNNLEEFDKRRNEEHLKPNYISDVFNRKYASMILITTLYQIPSTYYAYIFNSILNDLKGSSHILKAHACFLLERISIESDELGKKDDISTKILIEISEHVMTLLQNDQETVRLSAIMTIPLFLSNELFPHTSALIEKHLMTILSSILQTSGQQDNETLDQLILLYPNHINEYSGQIILSLFNRIIECHTRGKKELVSNYMRSISELILLGRSKAFDKNNIIKVLNENFSVIFSLLITDYYFLHDIVDMLSNFIYALNDSQFTFPYVDKLFSLDKDELLCVSDELSGLLDNLICYHNTTITPLNNGIAKYLVQYKHVSQETDIKKCITDIDSQDIITILASDFLSSLFNLPVEGNSPYSEKIAGYVDFYKQVILNDTTYIFEDEYIQLCKVFTSVLLTFTKKSTENLMQFKFKEYLDFLLNNREMLEDGSQAHLFSVAVIFIILIRAPEFTNELSTEQLDYIFEIFYKSTGSSLRLHEYNIFLIFYTRMMNLTNIFKNMRQEHIRKMAYCFNHYFKNYDKILLERYSGEEEDSYDNFTEDLCFISPLDNINSKMLLIDSLNSLSENSLGKMILNSLTPEEMEEVKAAF